MGGEAQVVTLRPDPAPEEEAHGLETVPRPLRVLPLAGLDRVGVVLVSHSRAVAEAVAAMAAELLGTGDPAPIATAGSMPEDGLGTGPALVAAAAREVDQGMGVAVIVDLDASVDTVRGVLAAAEAHGLPFPVRLADAPFVEGAVAAVATASAGGDLSAVIESAEDCYVVRKL
ncbi:PTS fructose transporter subunit IIA [Streptacidiphilus sp. EB103A]|uniref:PTS sugar transporter subunit IIA domain-containing protein n=1 Tax=Streptacidiphilus sp. EB103A TaxID=3156275 RepID=UPI003514A9CF